MLAPPTLTSPRRCGRREARTLLLGALALVLLGGRSAAGEPPERVALEQAVKAAYLYNFAQFVSWPTDSPLAGQSALTIGVLGDAAFARAVDATVRGKRVAGRPFAVRSFASIDDATPCAVLYLERAMAERLPELKQRLSGWPVLTVSDASGFTSRGGMIGMFLEDGRVRFEVGAEAARAARLKVSSKLLRLSRPVAARPCPACVSRSGGER